MPLDREKNGTRGSLEKMRKSKQNKAMQKLRGRAGETIAETLIALLISALALVMLAGAIAATANMITTSDRKMGQYYENDSKLATHTTPETTKLSISIGKTGGISETRTASYYLNDAFANKPVVAYKADVPTT